MVFESIVADVLNRFLGDYVQNFDSSKLKLGIWGGDVTLTHLDVKESALDELDLPVQVVSGHLGDLVLKIPWKNMYTAPVIATIKGLYIVVIPNLAVKYNAEKEQKAEQQAKQAELQRIEEAKQKEAQKKESKEDKDTFTEKLVTQIIKNLQVKIIDIHIRYEDIVSDPRNPFSFGFTLHNLSFETTNEKWIPTIIQENVSIIHKLVTLDSLAFYWNSNSSLFSKMSPEERQANLEKCIATSTIRPPDVSYMLGPINSTAQLRLNSKPELDEFKTPKVWLNVVMEEIAVGLSKTQYRDLMKMLESFDRMTIATLYRKYRPDVPHAGHAKEWWGFAINAILEEDVRRKKRNWSWDRMKAHRQQCNLYKELYVSKLTGKKLSTENHAQLCTCENELDLFNITVARKQAELEHLRRAKATEAKPKATWGSWVGGWFSSSSPKTQEDTSAEKNIVKQFEEAMTSEEKSKLYEAIGYQEQPSLLEYPKEFIENKVMFLLRHLTLILSDNTKGKKQNQVLRTLLNDVSACLDQRPSAEALCIDAKIESFTVQGVPKTDGSIPVMAMSQEDKNSTNLPLLNIAFETNPLDGSCDSSLYLHAQPLEIYYDALTINMLTEVFTPPEQIDFHQLQAAALLKLEEMKEMSAFGLQYAIEQHKYLHLEVDMKPCFCIIPEKGCYGKHVDMLIVSFGNFKMGSIRRDPESPTVRSMVKAGSTEDEVLTTMLDKAYDKYYIEVRDAQIVLANSDSNWRKLFDSEKSHENLLQPLSVKIDFHKSIVTLDPRMPKIKIQGVLPELHLNISDFQIYNVLKIVGSIPFTQSSPPPETAKSKVMITAVDTSNVNAKVLNKAKREAVETFRTTSSDSDEIETVKEPMRVQSTDMEMKFEIEEFKITLFNHVTQSVVRALKFAFHQFGIQVTMRTFDMQADVYLGGILLEHTGFNDPDENAIKLIHTPINELEHMFSLTYLQADKKGPDFVTVYKSTLQKVVVNMKGLDFILHQEAILACMEFTNNLLSKMEEYLGTPKQSVPLEPKRETSKMKLDKKGGTKQKKGVKVIDMEIIASMDWINILVCNMSYNLTEIEVKGLKASIKMDKMKTCLTSSLQDLIVTNPVEDALYRKMVTTDAERVLHLDVVLYNFGTDDENLINLDAVDMSVSVNLGRMYIVFLNKFISSLLNFLNHFQAAKDKVMEASAAAAEVAKHGMEQAYEQDTRIKLNIIIHAPMIIIPKNSISPNTIVVDLGTLTISNMFEFGHKRNELGIPAILDKLALNLEELKLSRALVNPDTVRVTAECLVLKPVSFVVAIVRNLSTSWYTEQPDVDIYGKLCSLKVSLSQEDYSTAMSILSENLAESAEELETLPSSQSSGTSQVAEKEFTKASVTVSEAVQLKSAPKDFPQKLTIKLRLVFEMDSASAKFYTGKTELSQPVNVHDTSNAIGMVDVQMINIDAKMKSDGSLSANVILQDFILQDTRPVRTKGITRLMERTSKDQFRKMMTVCYDQSSTGDQNVDVKISSFTLVACLPYIIKLGEFFSPTEQPEIKSATPSSGNVLVGSTAPSITPATTKEDVKPVSSGTMIISLFLEQPDIVLIEDMDDIDSNAIFFNNEITAKLTMSDDVKNISGKITNLTFYTASFNPLKREASMVKILNPSEIDLQCNIRADSMHVDLLFKDLVLQISPGTVQLAVNILSTLTTEKVEQVETETAVEDYSNLWKVRSLRDCNFWFLDTLSGKEKVVEASEDLIYDPPTNDANPSEQMLFTMKKVIVTVEAGVGTRTVPLLLLESSFQAQISDWSTDINMESSLSIELLYYNEKNAVWEPLLEPVETPKGHRSWELFIEMSQKSQVTEDEPEEQISTPLKFEIKSDDNLELTVSKTCLDVLTNLSEAFGEAVKQNVVRDDKLPYAPFRVYNYLGVPLTIVLNNVFQVLDMKDDYGTVILESGSPPLHLTAKSTSKFASKVRQTVLKKQFTKEDSSFNIRIAADDMNIERRISIACTQKSYFQLPRRTYPGDQWGFIVDIKSLYGSKIITFHSNIVVHNHFSIPIDVYYMVATGSEVEFCGTALSGKDLHLPLQAVYTLTSALFFKPVDQNKSYSLSLEPFKWKELIVNPSTYKTIQCKFKDSAGHSFFINVAGDVERVFFEETSKKTVSSTLYKINLYPTVRLRNLLVYPVHYSLQGVNRNFILHEGESDELWSAEIGKTELEMRLVNYLDRDWACYKTLDIVEEELTAWTFASSLVEKLITMELGMHTRHVCGSLVMELYSPYCMVNKTGLLLVYRRSKKGERFEGKERKGDEGNSIYHPPKPEQPVLFSFRAKSFFSKKKASLKINDSEWSDKFSLDAVGSSGNVIAKTKDGKTYGVGVQIRLSQSGLTKIIIFTPFYILVNNCKFDIECREVDFKGNWIEIRKDECVPFWPQDSANSHQMVARYFGDDCETEKFTFKDSHSTLLKLSTSKGGIHIDCQVAQSSIILTFEDYIPGHAAALLINYMAEYTLSFSQSGCNSIDIHPYTCMLYTWQNPLEKRVLHWKCGDKKEGGSLDLVKDGVCEFKPGPGVIAYWLSFLDGMQRVIVFTHDLISASAVRSAVQAVHMDQEFLVTLRGVGLSLINNDSRLEIMYMGITSTGIVWEGKKPGSTRFKPLSLKECTILESGFQRYVTSSRVGNRQRGIYNLEGKLEVSFDDMKMFKPTVKKLKRTFQTGLWLEYKTSAVASHFHAKINRLQIDNQLADCVFPIVLAPVPPPKSVAAENAPKPFTELSIMLHQEEKSVIQQIKYCKMLIQEFHVKLDQGFINSMITFFTPDEAAEINYEKIIAADKKVTDSPLKDVAAIYSSQEKKCYYDNLHFSPLKMHISFSMTGGGAGGGKLDNKPTPIHSDFLNLLLQSVGVTLTEVQDVIFKLDYFERRYTFMSTQQLISEATNHYVGQAIKQLYMLVLGLDVIGNPVGLILGLGEGVSDLFYEPFQGAIQGPEEFFEGLGLGVKSLFGHAIGGAAGAASRITGTLGKGLAALTLDKDYQRKRRQNLNRRPQDVGQRFAQSGKGLVMGVFDGVTGVVTKPLEGAREEGVGGFFKGVGKGLIGVITRPTAGAVDFVSGSFDSVKRIAELQDEVKRLRPPRYIKSDGVIRPYVKRESEGSRLLQEVEKGKYATTDVYEGHVPVGTDEKSYLLVTNNRVMYVTKGDVFGQWNTEWEYRWEELKGPPTVTDDGIKILLKEPHKKKLSVFGSKIAGKLVHVQDLTQSHWIVGKMEDIMKTL